MKCESFRLTVGLQRGERSNSLFQCITFCNNKQQVWPSTILEVWVTDNSSNVFQMSNSSNVCFCLFTGYKCWLNIIIIIK